MKYLIKSCCLLLVLSYTTLLPKISVIWQTNKWEEDWLMELMEGLDIEVVDDFACQEYRDTSIIIISAPHMVNEYQNYFKKLHELGYKFGVIVLSDELYTGPTDFYRDAQFVFRNYWHKKFISNDTVHTFALGYKRGFWKNGKLPLKKAHERKYLWSFAGQIIHKPSRAIMIEQMKQLPYYSIHETFSFTDPQGLAVDRYRDIFLDTLFAPCPRGFWNLDSFRVYEALECGCIPIVEKYPTDYFGNFFGEHPFLVVDSWEQAPHLIKELLVDPSLLEQRRSACYQWWIRYKKNMNILFVRTITEALVRA